MSEFHDRRRKKLGEAFDKAARELLNADAISPAAILQDLGGGVVACVGFAEDVATLLAGHRAAARAPTNREP